MYQAYNVESFDTINSIANKFGVTPDGLRQINGVGQQYIPGATIVVPTSYSTYIVQKGDTLFGIASKNGIDAKTLAAFNGINLSDYIYPNQELLIPKRNSNMYITESDDTLKSVSNKLGIDPMILYTLNEEIKLMPDQIIYYKKEKL